MIAMLAQASVHGRSLFRIFDGPARLFRRSQKCAMAALACLSHCRNFTFLLASCIAFTFWMQPVPTTGPDQPSRRRP